MEKQPSTCTSGELLPPLSLEGRAGRAEERRGQSQTPEVSAGRDAPRPHQAPRPAPRSLAVDHHLRGDMLPAMHDPTRPARPPFYSWLRSSAPPRPAPHGRRLFIYTLPRGIRNFLQPRSAPLFATRCYVPSRPVPSGPVSLRRPRPLRLPCLAPRSISRTGRKEGRSGAHTRLESAARIAE